MLSCAVPSDGQRPTLELLWTLSANTEKLRAEGPKKPTLAGDSVPNVA